MDAADELVDAARRLAGGPSGALALSLYERALSVAPDRLDLHLEAAELQIQLGLLEHAHARLEALASTYLDRDMIDEAQAVIAFIEGEPQPKPEPGSVLREAQTGMTEPMTVVLGVPRVVEATHTEFCQVPILLYPNGTPLPGQRHGEGTTAGEVPASSPKRRIIKAARPGSSLKITSLSAPALRRPRRAGAPSKRD